MIIHVAPTYFNDGKYYINLFDISDIIIYFHIKLNRKISLTRLLALLFFYKTYYNSAPYAYRYPVFEDVIEVKKDFIFIYDINRKYRKQKKSSLTITQLFYDKFEANIKKDKSRVVKMAHHLTISYSSKKDRELKEEVKSIIIKKRAIRY